ncbi:hypothetical protein FNJ87_20295, partial [Nonlabens mediterrranea]|nr:hypothetical protein [Nonlabens mediterrranea]
MRDKTIDYILRATWMSISKMYNEQAAVKGSTMATGFALISIDPIEGTPSTALGPKMGSGFHSHFRSQCSTRC